MTQPKSIPIACTLTDEALNLRKDNELSALFKRVIQTKSLENGYSFQFSGDEETAQLIFEFIKTERHCCAFFQFDLKFEPQNGPIWLTLSGGEGVKAFIESQGILLR